ncbi:MAG: mRNA interferase RelE/StbE [Candidatus Methanocomedens sp.]|nr:MAG: mRNA interferase RelE/StbE [ANME-2 cluster archaeon]MCD4810970.1 type II toxin-antitoxin system RelE/ParE family toxin [Methanosarcinales archaeon]NOR47325.1 type II toxin-antitoxin system RelE/ParE family toxin [Methanosarcinaceae archaeon]
MTFEILWDPKAISQLRKLPSDVSSRIVKKVRLVGETGFELEVLKDHQYGFRIRVGDYRVLCDVDYNPHRILIRVVGHRRKIYKR